MITVHTQIVVNDYDTWKVAFDEFAPVRASQGVLAHRVGRLVGSPNHVSVDLDFDSEEHARAFVDILHTIWEGPDTRSEFVEHEPPLIYEVTEVLDQRR